MKWHDMKKNSELGVGSALRPAPPLVSEAGSASRFWGRLRLSSSLPLGSEAGSESRGLRADRPCGKGPHDKPESCWYGQVKGVAKLQDSGQRVR